MGPGRSGAAGHLIPQAVPSPLRPGWGETCLGKEAKRDDAEVCRRCWSVAPGRGAEEGKTGELFPCPAKRILLHTCPEATQPQTRTCTQQTRTQPVRRAELPGRGPSPAVGITLSAPTATQLRWARRGRKGWGQSCALFRGAGTPQDLSAVTLLLTPGSSQGGMLGCPAAPAQAVLLSGTPRATVL